MTKLEEVARAIYYAEDTSERPDWDRVPPAVKARFLRTARAAIEAMREPGEIARNEGWDAATQMVTSYGFAIGGEMSVWSAMIDAILSEGE